MTRPTRIAVAAAALLAALGGGAAVLADTGGGMTVGIREALVEVPSGPTTVAPVRIDTTLYIPSTATRSRPAPAVVVSPGFGQSKTAVDADARDLAAHATSCWPGRCAGSGAAPAGSPWTHRTRRSGT